MAGAACGFGGGLATRCLVSRCPPRDAPVPAPTPRRRACRSLLLTLLPSYDPRPRVGPLHQEIRSLASLIRPRSPIGARRRRLALAGTGSRAVTAPEATLSDHRARRCGGLRPRVFLVIVATGPPRLPGRGVLFFTAKGAGLLRPIAPMSIANPSTWRWPCSSPATQGRPGGPGAVNHGPLAGSRRGLLRCAIAGEKTRSRM